MKLNRLHLTSRLAAVMMTVAASALTAGAYDFVNRGWLIYNITSSTTAEVFSSSETRTDTYIITSTVSKNGRTYTVTAIADEALSSCTQATKVTIPNTIKTIGSRAFAGCPLASITIPSSVQSIASDAFYWCSQMTSVVVNQGNTNYDSRNNCNAIIEKATNTLVVGCNKTVIPESVTAIGDNAFSCRKGLKSITIPSSVTSIGQRAFYYCTALESIVSKIRDVSEVPVGAYAFSNVPTSTCVLTVPRGTKSLYQRTSPWSAFLNIVESSTPPDSGDVNGDGVVDMTDLNMVANAVIGQPTSVDCDVNGDGFVDVRDMNAIINIILDM